MRSVSPVEAALYMGGLGYSVFPCAMIGGAKRPLIKEWPTEATDDAECIRQWWARHPRAMVGLAHRASGTMALDIDCHDEGANGWETMVVWRLAGVDDTPTAAFRTLSGGAQRLYARPADLADLSGNYSERPAAAGKPALPLLGPALDVIFGYSVLPSGDATPGRQWVNAPDELWPQPAPEWILRAVRERAGKAAAAASQPRPVPPPPPRPATADDAASMRYVIAAVAGEQEVIRALASGTRQTGLAAAAANVGRALARRSRSDLADWAAAALASTTEWTAAPHERRTISKQIEWGLRCG